MVKELFVSELGKISDPVVREWVEHALELAPSYFVKVAASTSGKYHPASSLGEGGLVRHTKSVVMFAERFAELFSVDKDILVGAALLHDLQKNGAGFNLTANQFDPKDQIGGMSVTKTHGVVTAKWLGDSLPSANPKVIRILACIRTHMGKWGPEGISPTAPDEIALSCSDYAAAQRFVKIEGI